MKTRITQAQLNLLIDSRLADQEDSGPISQWAVISSPEEVKEEIKKKLLEEYEVVD